jgi:hypothetical protein
MVKERRKHPGFRTNFYWCASFIKVRGGKVEDVLSSTKKHPDTIDAREVLRL